MDTTLSAEQQQVLDLLRMLPPPAVREVHDFATFLAARHCDWKYSDDQSLETAVDLMAQDPFLRRELTAINRDFSDAGKDGLEDW